MKCWKTFGLKPAGCSGLFVEEETFLIDERIYPYIPTLSADFLEGGKLLVPDLDKALAVAHPSAEDFVLKFAAAR